MGLIKNRYNQSTSYEEAKIRKYNRKSIRHSIHFDIYIPLIYLSGMNFETTEPCVLM